MESEKKCALILERIRLYIESVDLLEAARRHKYDFTRTRSLTFQRLTLFILNLARKTLQIEIYQFAEKIKVKTFTKQAFSKARMKLDPIVFKLLNDNFVSEFYTDNDITTWHNFRILGVDGLKLQLPLSDEIANEYGYSSSQYGKAIPAAQASIVFDVLNKVALHSLIAPNNTPERALAAQHLDKLAEMEKQAPSDAAKIINLLMYDRGYPSTALLARHHVEKRPYVFRCQKSLSPSWPQ